MLFFYILWAPLYPWCCVISNGVVMDCSCRCCEYPTSMYPDVKLLISIERSLGSNKIPHYPTKNTYTLLPTWWVTPQNKWLVCCCRNSLFLVLLHGFVSPDILNYFGNLSIYRNNAISSRSGGWNRSLSYTADIFVLGTPCSAEMAVVSFILQILGRSISTRANVFSKALSILLSDWFVWGYTDFTFL